MTWLWRISFDRGPAGAGPITAGAGGVDAGSEPITAGARGMDAGAGPITAGAGGANAGSGPITAGAGSWKFRRTVAGLLLAGRAVCGTITGSVSLSHSHVPAVQKGRDFSGVVIWLDPVGPAARIPSRAMRVTMEQKDKRFTPHVLAAQVGATVAFPNRDPIFHSAFSNFSGQIFDLGLYPPKTSREVTFNRPGVVRIFCNIHPSMSAVIVVLRSPWFAVSGESGVFTIHDVAPGDYRLRLFHERATEETLSKLERRVTVGAGDLQLPTLDISESGYIQAPHKNKYGGDYPPVTEDGAYPTGRK